MIRAFRQLFLLPALVMLPALGLAQTNAQSGKIDPVKLKAKLLQAAFIEGHLVEIKEEEKHFSFQHINEVKKANKTEQTRFNALNARWNQALAMRTTSLEDLKKLQAECRAAYKTAFEIEQTPIDFELSGGKTLAVRTLQPPTDADGKPKRLTFAEQQKLKGDARYPGYIANLKDIEKTTWVRVYLDKSKKPAPAKEGETPVYPITMIVVIPPPAESDPFVIPGS